MNDNLPAGYKEDETTFYCDCGNEISEFEADNDMVCIECR